MTKQDLNAAELLARLVALDSTSTRSNLPVIELLERELDGLGFSHQRQEWTDGNGARKANLIGTRGVATSEIPGLALVGHSDCVPFDPNWDGALKGNIEDGKLYGRGSADTKGFISAALAAASRARAHSVPLMVLVTADEEVGCLGAKRLLEFFDEGHGLQRPRRAIIGEPTRLVPVRGHKGYCLAEIVVTGVEGHSAYPETGASAILAAGELLRRLEALGVRLREDSDPLFNPPYTTLNIGLIQGGTAKNVIPGQCRLTVEWRPLPKQDPRRVLHEVEALCTQLSTGRIRAEIRASRLDAGIAAPEGELLRFLERESGHGAETIPFGTELPELSALGAEACVFGPGDIRVAHRTGEFVSLEDLNRVTDILTRAIETFCG